MALTRRGRLAVTLTVAVLLVGAFAYLLTRTPLGSALGLGTGPPCSLEAGGATYGWSFEEAMTATTVAGVGTRIGADADAVAAALAASLRPEPVAAVSPEAARAVYRGLPDEPAPGQEDVRAAAALLGRSGEALTCVLPLTGTTDLAEETVGPGGLTPRADALRREMRRVFGRQPLGGFSPGGVSSGHIDGSAHYDGRAVDVFFRPVTEANQRLGRQQALWSVAHAQRLGIATVIFDRRVWTTARSVQGWRDYRHPSGESDNPVLMHEDHVHVDVTG